jgi:hypothetical protein
MSVTNPGEGFLDDTEEGEEMSGGDDVAVRM